MDQAFGKMRTTLRELDLRENTLLGCCSDNGALPKVGSSSRRCGQKGQIDERWGARSSPHGVADFSS